MEKVYVFLDVETTGLKATEEKMTEICMIKTDEEFNVIDKFVSFINPEKSIPEKITELTGITESMVAEAPTYNEIIPIIHEWYYKDTEGKQVIGVAHNMPFDMGFINQAGKDIIGKDIITNWYDTVSIVRELFPFWKNHKLETCAKKFGIVNENHHRAENDVVVLIGIGKRLISEALEDGLDILNFRTTKKLHYNN